MDNQSTPVDPQTTEQPAPSEPPASVHSLPTGADTPYHDSGPQAKAQKKQRGKPGVNPPGIEQGDFLIDQDVSATSGDSRMAPSAGHWDTSADTPPGWTAWFMPVHQLRAQVFLAHGLLYPSAYDDAGLSGDFDDIQRQDPGRLTLFASPVPTRKHQIQLRVLLRQEDDLITSHGGQLASVSTPLPVSRLTRIYVPESAGDIGRYLDGWLKPDVPVPRMLFSTQPDFPDAADFEPPYGKPSEPTNAQQVREAIQRYDRYLGVMAYMRNAERYLSSKTGKYADYPEAFLSLSRTILGVAAPPGAVRSPVPNIVRALLDEPGHVTHSEQLLLDLIASQPAYVDEAQARAIATDIFKNAGEDDKLARAFKSLLNDDYRAAIKALQDARLPPAAAILAFLYKYSMRSSSDLLALKPRLHEDWDSTDMLLPALAFLGAYYGYTALPARETSLYSVHPLIKPWVDDTPHIKFHLDTHQERRLIEALYDRAFSPTSRHDTLPPPTVPTAQTIPPRSMAPESPLLTRRTYTLDDLQATSYEVTGTGRVVQRLADLPVDSIDQKSQLGKCILFDCFPLASDRSWTVKGNKESLSFKISRRQLVDLVTQKKLSVSMSVLEAALDADMNAPQPS